MMAQKAAGIAAATGIFAAACLALAVRADDDAEKPKEPPTNYSGQWVNKRRGTSGPIKCVLQKAEEGEWSARFEGTFKGDPFQYDVKFSAEQKGTAHNLKGEAKVSGEPYEWTGALKGDILKVKYQSSRGNFGEFALKKQADRKQIDRKKRK